MFAHSSILTGEEGTGGCPSQYFNGEEDTQSVPLAISPKLLFSKIPFRLVGVPVHFTVH